MKIVSADIYDVDLRKERINFNPVILRLTTDEGIYGVGEFAMAYGTGAKAGVGILKQMVEDFVIGADPFLTEQMWHTLYRTTFWGQGGGPVIYGGMSAIDEALWDIKGKALGLPVHVLLGGPTAEKLRVYANGWSNLKRPDGRNRNVTPEEYYDTVQMVIEDGYNALKFDPFYITPSGTQAHPQRLLDRDMMHLVHDRVEAVRRAVGPEFEILIEVHGCLGTATAIEVGRSLVELRPFVYEEPVDAMNVECMLKVAQNVPIPIAAGERLYTRYGFREYIEKQAIDVLQPDLGLAGGITEVKKIAAHAETYDLHVQPHHAAGPISTAASLQIDASITNFIIQEWRPYTDRAILDLVEEPFDTQAVNGYIDVPKKPGLGVTLNEAVIARHACLHLS